MPATSALARMKQEEFWVPGQPGLCMKTLDQNTSHNNSNKTNSSSSWNVCKGNPLDLLKKKVGKIHMRVNLYSCMKPQPSMPELLKVNTFWIFKGFKKLRCELLTIIQPDETCFTMLGVEFEFWKLCFLNVFPGFRFRHVWRLNKLETRNQIPVIWKHYHPRWKGTSTCQHFLFI